MSENEVNTVDNKPVAECTDSELMCLFMGLYHSIYVMDCFGGDDIDRLIVIENELNRRGISAEDESHLVFYKDGEEIESLNWKDGADGV